MTDQILGHYGQQSDERGEYLALSFSPLSAPLRSRWRNNGVSADFLGDYVMTFLPTDGDLAASGSQQSEIRHAVIYIANEFLENAMKYHERAVDIPIGIRLELTDRLITVSASNSVGAEQAQRYKTFAQSILLQDPGELLVKQLEEGSRGAENSCLGLLTMMTDYGVQLGWKFERHGAHPEVMTVTTTAILPLAGRTGAAV